jgi:hypothetical protein
MADEPRPVQRALAWLLIVLGAAWILLTGGCTLAFLGDSLASALHSPNGWGGALIVLLIYGVVGVLPGVAVIISGRNTLREQRRNRP